MYEDIEHALETRSNSAHIPHGVCVCTVIPRYEDTPYKDSLNVRTMQWKQTLHSDYSGTSE